MKKVTLTLAAAMITIALSAQWGTGMIYVKGASDKFKKTTPSTFGFSGTLPTSFSLKSYSPYPKNQGGYGTCASWASSYSALTTQFALSMGITDRNIITSMAFCPFFTHNGSSERLDTCSSGRGFDNIFGMYSEKGAKKYYLPLINCGTMADKYMTDGAKAYVVNNAYQTYIAETFWGDADEAGYTQFFNRSDKFSIEKVKTVLASGYVPVFAAVLPPSFSNLMGKDLWELSAQEKSNPGQAQTANKGFAHSFHAMTIVSYDDNKYGGAFEIMNSWGTAFGKNGYIWVKYADLQKYVYWMIWYDFKPQAKATTGCIYGDCNNGYGIAKFDNGDMYEGFFTNGIFNGFGIYAWANGQTYDGEFKDGKRAGDATVYYTNGSYGGVTYADDKFLSGYMNGKLEDGTTFDGTVKNGSFNGFCKFKFTTGATYVGTLKDDKYSGFGLYKFPDGSYYVGEWADGQYNGNGISVSSTGSVWAGKWSYDKFVTGKKYGFSGSNKNTAEDFLPSSNLNYKDASCKTGDCLSGEGTREYGAINGYLKYQGTFKDGLEYGVGKYLFDNGSLSGFFEEGNLYGAAMYKWNTGDIRIGLFNGGWDGYCLYITSSGEVIIQQYSKGTKINQMTSGNQTDFTGLTAAQPAKGQVAVQPMKKLK